MKHIRGIVRNKQLVTLAVLAAVLLSGLFLFSQATPVQGVSGTQVLSCNNNTRNGGICSSNAQCQSGYCAGTTGSCTTSGAGTCQTPPSLGGGDIGVSDDSGLSDGTDDGGGVCTQEAPVAPSYLSASFSDVYSASGVNNLSITIPGDPDAGVGDAQQVAVILANQSFSEVSDAMWSDTRSDIHSAWNLVAGLTTGGNAYYGQSLRVGVRNWKDCMQAWSAWREISPITQSDGGGGDVETYSCSGSQPSNSTMCSGDDSGLTSPASWAAVSSCTSAKCEATCSAGYTLSNGACIPIASNVCYGSYDPLSTMCSSDDTGLTQPTQWGLVASCTKATKCERTCPSGYTAENGLCVLTGTAETGNVFGWAWSSNIGWVKMNSCEDAYPIVNGVATVDGVADDGTAATTNCQTTTSTNKPFAVTINNGGTMGGPGTITGHAWSPSIGWIKFGNLSGFPSSAEPYTQNATLQSDSMTIKGWAKAVLGDLTSGWDGWISLSGPTYPSGFTDGTRGLTYHAATGRIVGYAWGGDVVGWLYFGGSHSSSDGYPKVTYGKPSGKFDFHLSAMPVYLTIDRGTQKTTKISRILDAGVSEAVTITSSISEDTPLTVSIPGATQTCNPTCSTTVTIAAWANAEPGIYNVVFTGVSGATSRTVTVTVEVIAPTLDAPIDVTCELQDDPPYLVNAPLTWVGTVAGGVPPLTYQWSGDNGLSGTGVSVTKIYQTTGIKHGKLTVTDANGNVAVCPQAEATVIVRPSINEF